MRFITFLGGFLLTSLSFAQINIVSSFVQPVNVSPSALTQVSIVNNQQQVNASLTALITNSAGQEMLRVTSATFTLLPGLNTFRPENIQIASVSYGNGAQAAFVKTNNILPSGLFRYCAFLSTSSSEEQDEYCVELNSDFSSFLMLVTPSDGDTIESVNPVLFWTHTEPFSLLAPGESFKLILTECGKEESPQSAVSVNLPIFVKPFLTKHDIQYPFDAPKLEEGKSYAWQVQKLSAGSAGVIDQTEAWKFTVRKDPLKSPVKYALLRKKLDAGFYTCKSDHLFFRFDEYYSGNILNFEIVNDKGQKIEPVLRNDRTEKASASHGEIKSEGVNLFDLDIANYNLKRGYYLLTVWNNKNEKYFLKFYVEK